MTAIICRDLVLKYAELVAVSGLNLEVETGECFGLLGPNGAGKTTTVEAIEGLKAPHAGSLEVFGQVWGTRRDRALRKRLGVALQETRLPDKLTVRESVRLFASFYGNTSSQEEVIGRLGLTEKATARVERLSGGQKQRLALACALVGKPDLLILDEPTTGLDPTARLAIWDIILEFKAMGGTVLITTHYMEEAERLCDRVGIMHAGRVVALGSPQELIGQLGADQVIELEASLELSDAELGSIEGVRSVSRRGDRVVILCRFPAKVLPFVFEAAARTGATVSEAKLHPSTLEDVFVHLTGRRLADG
ncbi:MAG: ABC transporter ATP-binding protein [Myxococcota bacterium]|jgi:ABC-2 type transport system ATP-binding protein|nr:ABC transporter ATP-binding protein [Myxococcota bacterium]